MIATPIVWTKCTSIAARRRSFTLGGHISTSPVFFQLTVLFFCSFFPLRFARKYDKEFNDAVGHLSEMAIKAYKKERYNRLKEELSLIPSKYGALESPIQAIIDRSIPIHAIRSRTEKLLWHQRLGHPCDEYLYNAHKTIDGVPKFDQETPVLDTCPVCIQAKQSKEPSGPNTTQKATVAYQGLSIDFSFSGVKSKNKDRRSDYEGFNGQCIFRSKRTLRNPFRATRSRQFDQSPARNHHGNGIVPAL